MARRGSSSAKGSARSAGSSATRSGVRSGSSGRTPTAWRSPRTPRARRSRSGSCPRRHEADFSRMGAPDIAATAEALRQVLAQPRVEPRRAAVQPRPPHRAAARTGRRDVPLALGDPPAPARDRRPRAGNRTARESRLARRRGGGTPRPRRARREVRRVERLPAGHPPASHRGEVHRLWPSERVPCRLRIPSTRPHGAFVAIDRSAPTFATRSAARSRGRRRIRGRR